MHSPADVIVSCTAPVPQEVSLENSEQATREECFSSGRHDLFNVLMSLEGDSEILSEDAFDEKYNATAQANLEISDLEILAADEDNNDLEKRQCGAISRFSTRRVGNGNPHQNPMNVQLSVCFITEIWIIDPSESWSFKS